MVKNDALACNEWKYKKETRYLIASRVAPSSASS